MTSKKWWMVAAGIIILGLLFSLGQLGRKTPVIGNTEPERGGPKMVAINGTTKLVATVSNGAFFIIKDDLSNYILNHVDAQAQSASIENTQLNTDGSVQLKVAVNKNVFVADASQNNNDQLIFQVPATHYTTTSTVPQTESDFDDD
jgi:hypothetical protein